MRREDRPTRWLFRLGHRKPSPAQEVEWEIEHYLAERTDRLVEEGWDPEEARKEAERRFGSLERYRPKITRVDRRKRRMRMMGTVMSALMDGLRDAGRTFRRSPGFALAVVLTLGLGLGANAAMFGIVDRLLLRPPDHIRQADRVRLVGVTRTNTRGEEWTQQALTFPDVQDLEGAAAFETAAYAYPTEMTLGDGTEAVSVETRSVSHDFFGLLGASPVLGRTFAEDEDRVGAAPTTVLSHELWTRRYGGDTEILGRSVELSGRDYVVVGIAPKGFTGVTLQPVDLWIPVETAQAIRTGSEDWRDNRYSWWISAVVRLNDGVTVEAARDEATAVHRAGRSESIEANRYDPDARIDLQPLIAAADTPEGRVSRWLLGVAFVVLLIAAANVANLLLARGVRTHKESAVRLALGVSRGRLTTQRSVEAIALATVGGALALVIAKVGTRGLGTVLLPDVLFADVLNTRVVGFTVAASLFAGVLAGLAPALQGSRQDLGEAIAGQSRGSSGRRSRLRGALTVTQSALSVVLLVGAGLFVRSLEEVRSLDLGLDVDRLALASLELSTADLSVAEETELYARGAERVQTLPAVRSATITHSPFQWGFSTGIRVLGVDSIPRMPGGGPYYYGVGVSYFETVGLEVLVGRGFQATDREGAQPVAVVSRSMADSLWSGAAVGECIFLTREDDPACIIVVGVVEDASRGSIETEPYFAWYRPIEQLGTPPRGLYARIDGDPSEVVGEIALALRTFSPQVRFARVESLREILDPQARSWTLGATMFTVFGLLALVVAAVGLYSLLAFDVAQRTRELGIRTALGAAKGRLLRGVVGEGVRLVAAGLILGLGIAWLAAPHVEDLLFDVQARDPWVLGGVGAVLLTVALAASLVPGWRATRIDPMEAVKTE